MPDTVVVGDFEVQLVAFFIQQNDGCAFDVEQGHLLDGQL